MPHLHPKDVARNNQDPLKGMVNLSIKIKHMSTKDYHCSIIVNKSQQEAFEAISKGVPEWWALDYTGSGDHLNDRFKIRFGETSVNFQVTKFQPFEQIDWQVTDSYLPWQKDKEEWTNTTIVWKFNSAGDKTTIDMTHVGLFPGVECYTMCEEGWNHFIKDSLLKLLTEGKGVPVEKGWRTANEVR